jgi:hypothetical protein
MKARIWRATSSPTPTRPTGGGRLSEHFAARRFRHGRADRRVDDPRRYRVDAYRRQLKRQRPRQRFERAVGNADDRGVGPGPDAEIARYQRERSTGADFGRFSDAPCAPELALHGGAHILHRNRLERAGAKLRRSDHDVVDRTAIAEQLGDAVVAGDVSGNCDRVQPFGDRIEALNIARGDDDIGAFALGHFGGGQADPRRAADHHDFLAFE